MGKINLILFTRNRCPLCDKAKQIIMELMEEDYNFYYKEIDIDTSEELTEKYGLMIPVININGIDVQYGNIDKKFITKAFT